MKNIYIVILAILFCITGIFYYILIPKNQEKTLENFKQLKIGTSYADVVKKFGKPDPVEERNSEAYTYSLLDGNKMS